jgi:hypothetical protein
MKLQPSLIFGPPACTSWLAGVFCQLCAWANTFVFDRVISSPGLRINVKKEWTEEFSQA